MKEFNDKVIESVDVETIPEKTEEDQTSAWSDESEFSIGQSVKKKAGNSLLYFSRTPIEPF